MKIRFFVLLCGLICFIPTVQSSDIIDAGTYRQYKNKIESIQSKIVWDKKIVVSNDKSIAEYKSQGGSGMLDEMIAGLEASSKNSRANIAKYNTEVKKYQDGVDRYDNHQRAIAEANRISSLNDRIDDLAEALSEKGEAVGQIESTSITELEEFERSLQLKLNSILKMEKEEKELAELRDSIAKKQEQLGSLGAQVDKEVSALSAIDEAKEYSAALDNKIDTSQRDIEISAQIERDRMDTIKGYISGSVIAWLAFCAIYCAIKGGNHSVVVFADYTDLALTFLSSIGLPFIISLGTAIYSKESGSENSGMEFYVIFSVFIIIQAYSLRNLYYLNGGKLFTSVICLFGRFVLCLSLVGIVFGALSKKQRNVTRPDGSIGVVETRKSFLTQILYLMFGYLLAKLLLLIVARNEFSSLTSFFGRRSFEALFSDEFMAQYFQVDATAK